jgi:F420-dependent oxidoreductase-like protein
MSMQLSVQLNYAGDARQTIAEAAALEAAGIDAIWVAEVYGFDGATILGALAAKTERVQLGSGIFNVYSRTPGLLAQTAAGLDAVSGGRAILGLGASGPQVIEGWHGLPYDKPLGRTREVVDIVRRALRREVITNDGIYQLPLHGGTGLGKPLKLLTKPVRSAIPFYLAALGDKNVALAAEIADGWMPTLFHPDRAKAAWGKSLAAGRAKRSAELGELGIVAGGALCITEDADEARNVLDAAKAQVALYVGGMGARGKNFYNELFHRYGYEKEAELIQDHYLTGRKAEAIAAVPDEFMRAANLVGPASFVAERVAALREAGVTMINNTQILGDQVSQLEQLRNLL